MAGITSEITFRVQNINQGNTIQLLMTFVISDIAVGVDYNAEDFGLQILNYGKLEMNYDLEDALLVPSKYSITIGDPEGLFDNYFFGAGDFTHYSKQAIVTLKINGVNKFIGRIIEDSIEYNEATRIVTFDAAPNTDAINKRMVYDENGNPLNPFSFTGSSYYHIIYILEKIYGLVNPSIVYPTSLEVIHDWQFRAHRDSPSGYLFDVEFPELYQLIDPLFFDNSYGIATCGDVLRRLAVDWCAFTGLISYEKAFLKKLFHYNENNLQTVEVYSWTKGYRYGLIDYVKLSTGISSPNEPYEEGIFTQLEDRFLVKKTLPGFFIDGATGSNVKAVISRTGYFVFTVDGAAVTTFPVEGDVYSNNSSSFEVVGILETGSTSKISTKRIIGSNDPSASGDLTVVTGSGDATIAYSSYGDADGTYTVYQTRDPNILNNAFSDHGDVMAKFWFKYRGNLQNCRVDKFTFKGIDYDFLKDFNYSGSKFQPIGMVFDYQQFLTECEAIYLGEL